MWCVLKKIPKKDIQGVQTTPDKSDISIFLIFFFSAGSFSKQVKTPLKAD